MPQTLRVSKFNPHDLTVQALRHCLESFHRSTLDAEVRARLGAHFEVRQQSSKKSGGFGSILSGYSSSAESPYILSEEDFVAAEAKEPFAISFVDGLRHTLWYIQCTELLLRFVLMKFSL